MITDRATSSEDQATVSALGTICDYYTVGIPQDEVKAKHNFEVKWEDWEHLQSKEIVEKLKAKIEAVNTEEYETDVLVHEVATETEDLKKLGYLLEYNYTLHKDFVNNLEKIIENLGHARPYSELDIWEKQAAYPYHDLPYKWDKEMGYPDANNDDVVLNVYATNMMQFQKDGFKSAVNRYYFDYLGRHQYLCTAEKLSGVQREE